MDARAHCEQSHGYRAGYANSELRQDELRSKKFQIDGREFANIDHRNCSARRLRFEAMVR